MTDQAQPKVQKTDQEWREELSEEQYWVMRQSGTEQPFSGQYCECKESGMYACAACGNPLFPSETKYESGTGWPSFYQPADAASVEEHEDTSHGMRRTEVRCGRCASHLGHVFADGPRPTGRRYCINSVALKLDEREPQPPR